MDSFGRGALTIAIDQENLEMVELLVVLGVLTKDSLLHAIDVEFVEAVELLLEHEELIHQEGEPYVCSFSIYIYCTTNKYCRKLNCKISVFVIVSRPRS